MHRCRAGAAWVFGGGSVFCGNWKQNEGSLIKVTVKELKLLKSYSQLSIPIEPSLKAVLRRNWAQA